MARYSIIGSGLTGATIARRLLDAGHKVVVYESRDCVGGNVADTTIAGIPYHKHGPHHFRTSSPRIFDFISRFTRLQPFRYRAVTLSQRYGWIPWPLTGSDCKRYGFEESDFQGKKEGRNFEEACLNMMPSVMYDEFVYPYTKKQWGREPKELSADLARRFDVRWDDETALKPNAKWQGFPAHGYTRMVENMLFGATVVLGASMTAKDVRKMTGNVVYTGSLDALMGYDLGPLPYRRQRRTTSLSTCERDLPCEQNNIPDLSSPVIRKIYWNKMAPEETYSQSLVTEEAPTDAECADEYEYPVPTPEAHEAYASYLAHVMRAFPKLLIAGRLAHYRYYDMDAAIGSALNTPL